ncbi:MAG: methylmalonyl-CoA epimerase [Pseudonocardia sp.]
MNELPGAVTTIDHVGIAVPDLEVAIQWYADTLGLQATHVEVNEEQGVREAMLNAPGDHGGPAVQLLAPLNENSTIAKFIGRNGPGIQQMAYRVRDIDATCAHLRTRGVRLLYDQPRRGTADSRINFVHPKDGGGVLIELVEPAANSAD